MTTTITDADRAAAADYSVSPEVIAAAREARAAEAAAWAAFEAYVSRPDHDIRSEEYAAIRRTWADAHHAATVTEHEVCEVMP